MKGITMVSNCLRIAILGALFICVIGTSTVRADDTSQIAEAGSASVTAVVVDQTDDGLLVKLTTTGKSQQGVPMLGKIPYVNRLFKNVGVAQVTRTVLIPCSESEAIVEFDTLQELASPEPVDDLVEFIPIDSEGELIQCDFAVPVSKHKYKDKAKSKKTSGKCKRVPCNCRKTKDVSVKKLQKQLLAIAVENAELRARAEAQEEIAQLKEKLLQDSAEAKVQIARFQAQAALASFARSRQPQHAPQQVQLRARQFDHQHHDPIVEQLKQENAALRKLVAELELKKQGQTKR